MTEAVDSSITGILQLSRDLRLSEAVEQAGALLAVCSEAARPLVKACKDLIEWRAAAHVGRVNEGLAEAIDAIRLLESLGYRPAIAWTFSRVGLALSQMGDFEGGLEWCQRGIEDAECAGNRWDLVHAWCNKGIVFGYTGDLDRAVEHFKKALELCGDDPEFTAVMALGNLSYCCILEAQRAGPDDSRYRQLADEAERYASAALARADSITEADAHTAAHARAEALSNRAHALRMLGRLDEAEAAFRAGLALSVHYPQTEVELAVSYADLLVEARRDAEAIALLDSAEAAAREEIVDQSPDRILELRIVLARRGGREGDVDELWKKRLQLAERRYRDRLQKVRTYEQILARAAQLSAELDQKRTEVELLEQKFELTARLQEERLLRERDRSRMEERLRLVRDMHDGFGSQLASARILAESREMGQRELAGTLDECLADLHLLVDVLGSEEASLPDAMADYRFRIQRRLENLPLKVTWDVDIEDAPPMPSKRILEIMRIVQEALNNALRHARARRIRIEGACGPAGDLVIRVVDDGVGIPPDVAGGRGIGNMRHRARGIGARLEFIPADPGTIVSLNVPPTAQ